MNLADFIKPGPSLICDPEPFDMAAAIERLRSDTIEIRPVIWAVHPDHIDLLDALRR